MGVAASWVHGARLCVIPHPDNNYHPLALRHKPLAFVSALLIATKVLTVGVMLLTPSTADLSTITTNRIIQLTNIERTAAGLKPLATNSKLMSAAQMKAQNMMDDDYFAHISPSGVTPWFWINKAGYTYQVAGENLAIDFTEAEDVVAAWMNSPTHKENILLPDYTETGVAVLAGDFQGGTSTIVVHVFGKPMAANAQANVVPATPSPTPAVKAVVSKATPTPSPSASPSPSPSPSLKPSPTFTVPPQGATPPPDAPRIPRIAFVNSAASEEDEISLHVEADPNAIVHFLINNKARVTAPLNEEGTLDYKLSLVDLPEGPLTIRAFTTTESHKQSDLSDSLSIIKVASKPTEQIAMSYMLAPDTDNAHFISLKDGATVALQKSELQPKFNQDSDLSFIAPPASLFKASRWLIGGVITTIIALLTLAIFVRIRTQRPALIAHASAVTVLAFILLFV